MLDYALAMFMDCFLKHKLSEIYHELSLIAIFEKFVSNLWKFM